MDDAVNHILTLALCDKYQVYCNPDRKARVNLKAVQAHLGKPREVEIIIRDLDTLVYDGKTDFDEFVGKVIRLEEELARTKSQLPEAAYVNYILKAMQGPFRDIALQISRTSRNPKLDDVYALLEKEYNMMTQLNKSGETSQEEKVVSTVPVNKVSSKRQNHRNNKKSSNTKKFQGDCWNCGESGHVAAKCTAEKATKVYKLSNL